MRGSRGMRHDPSWPFTYEGRLVVAKNPSGNTPSASHDTNRAAGAATSSGAEKSGGRYAIGAQRGGSIVLVEHGVHLDQVESDQLARIGEHLHRKMCFAIGHAARNRRANPRRLVRREAVEVEGDPDARRAVGRDRDRLFHHAAHAPFVDRAHGQGAKLPLADVFPFGFIGVAQADDRDVVRAHGRLDASHVHECAVAMAEQVRERHAMDVPGARAPGRIEVGVGIDPDHADPRLTRRLEGRGTGNGSRGQRVIATKQEWKMTLFERRFGQRRQVAAHARDRAEVTGAPLRAALSIFTEWNGNVPEIFNAMAELLEPFSKISVPDRIRAHVHATPGRAEVHRDADNSNGRHALR